MANYCSTSRTNYFRVTDEKKYAELFANLVGDEDGVEDFTETKDGITFHGFGSYGSIDYCVPPSDDDDYPEYDFDKFLSELQTILPDDEAFIYTESGYEKLRYITGFSIVVTKDKIESIDIVSGAIDLARKMLKNDKFQTQMQY